MSLMQTFHILFQWRRWCGSLGCAHIVCVCIYRHFIINITFVTQPHHPHHHRHLGYSLHHKSCDIIAAIKFKARSTKRPTITKTVLSWLLIMMGQRFARGHAELSKLFVCFCLVFFISAFSFQLFWSVNSRLHTLQEYFPFVFLDPL